MNIGIFFDLDGTLLDTLEDLTDSANYALAQFGLPGRSRGEIRSFLGNGALQLIALSLPGGRNDPAPEEVLKVYQTHYRAHCQDKTKPYPGILEALEQLKQHFPIAIVSNKPDAPVKKLCADYFPGLCALGETPDCPRKPAPDMILKALDATGTDACVYVGDSEVDILTGENARAPVLAVTWGFRDLPELKEAGGKYFCHNPRDLPEGILKITGEIYGK